MILVDACVLIAFYNEDDADHVRAEQLMEEIASGKYGGVGVAIAALGETLNVIAYKLRRKEAAIAFASHITSTAGIVPSERQDFFDAFKIFSTTTRRLSFADCEQLAIAKRQGHVIATFDAHLKAEAGRLAFDA